MIIIIIIFIIFAGKGLTMVAAAIEGNFTDKMAECIAAKQVMTVLLFSLRLLLLLLLSSS